MSTKSSRPDCVLLCRRINHSGWWCGYSGRRIRRERCRSCFDYKAGKAEEESDG